jgi:hypothetical protein
VACLLAAGLILAWANAAGAQVKTEAEERQRFETLLEYARSSDPPSRHTAHEEMVKFNQWIDDDLLKRIPDATVQERQLFWLVLYDRKCRKAAAPAIKMLPEAIERCRDAQVAVYEINEMRRVARKARRDGDNAKADELDAKTEEMRGRVPWNEVVLGDEISVLCAIAERYGHEDAWTALVDIAIASSTDDALAKGLTDTRRRTHRDKPLPGGTEMWNPVYTPVWEALRMLSRRPMEKKAEPARKKFTTYFETFKDKKDLGPNQEAAVKHYLAIKEQLEKTDKNTGEDGESKDEYDDGVTIIKG